VENNDLLLQVIGVTKTFPGVVALDDMNLSVKKGTIHALMGENGAGKSTLMKILTGYYQRDKGEILFEGKPLDTHSILSVIKQGISMIYQELNPIESMTVSENIFCGKEPCKVNLFYVDKKAMNKAAGELLEKLQITNIKPTDKLKDLSNAQKQLVEIAKAISNNSKLIIMDEPTSAITEKECQRLFHTVRQLKAEGISFIYITHKMDEIFDLCDEITVMRDGKYIATKAVEDVTHESLVAMMVGRTITNAYPKEQVAIGDVILEVKNLSAGKAFRNVSFELHRGEILGFAGLMGAGRTEVAETIFGIRPATGGEIYVDGKKANIHSPKDAIKLKLAMLTEDRRSTGCILNSQVYDNILTLIWKELRNASGINHKKGKEVCQEQIKRFSIKTPSTAERMQNLSGGNQQKVLLARWLLTNPDILILDEPTRGIDVGAKYEIYQDMVRLAKEGKAIIMISSELPEILGMSDRVLVMHEGDAMKILDVKDANQEIIMRYASGIE